MSATAIRKSRIVLDLTPGNIVTVPRSDMMYVVTEYGMANLKGKSVADRARAMIGLAHPDFREELERQAHAHRLIPKGYFQIRGKDAMRFAIAIADRRRIVAGRAAGRGVGVRPGVVL